MKTIKHICSFSLFACLLSLPFGCTEPFGPNSYIEIKNPNLEWNFKNYDFGQLPVGSTVKQTFVIANTGNDIAKECGPVQITDTVNFSITQDSCNQADMKPGDVCSVEISTHPTSTGEKTLQIQRECKDNYTILSPKNEIKVVAVFPNLQWDITAHDFGNVNQAVETTDQVFTLTNSGTGVATSCGLASLSNATDFAITSDTCGVLDLGIGQSCQISVKGLALSPGLKTTTLSRSCTIGGVVSTQSDEIKYTVNNAALIFDPSPYTLSQLMVGQSSNWNWVGHYNVSPDDATSCTAPVLSNTTDFSIDWESCGTTPITGNWGQCDVYFAFHPASVGSKSATITRTCIINGSPATAVLNISGEAIAAAPNFMTYNTSYDYGNVYIPGSGSDGYIYFYNTGTLSATGCGLASLDNVTDFSIVNNNCGTNDLAANSNCYVQVRANPSTLGTKTATLTRTCSAGGTATSVLSATGATASPNMYWGTNSYNFGNVNVGNNSGASNFYLYNSGTGAATGCSAPVLDNTTDFSIVSDGCSTNNMNGGWSSCNVQVRANPSGAGIKQATLSRTCSVGGTATTTTNGITVTGVLSAGWHQQYMLSNFNFVSQGKTSNAFRYFFVNANDSSLTGCTTPQLSNTNDFTITSDNCTSTMSATTICSVDVMAIGLSVGDKTAQLSRSCSETGQKNITLNSKVDGGGTVISLASDESYSCALYDSGKVKCWGGQQNLATPMEISNLSGAIQIAVGLKHGCAKLNDGSVKCWGTSEWGSAPYLGPNYSSASSNTDAVVVSGVTGANSVFASQSMSCAKLTDNSVKCWGGNFSQTPTDVAVFNDMIKLSGGCALKSNGTIGCYGGNTSFNGVTDAIDIAAEGSSCYLDNLNRVKCVNNSVYGQAGTGTFGYIGSLTFVTGISNAVSIFNTSLKTCAKLSDNTVKCWGDLRKEGLGITATPVVFPNLNNIAILGKSCAMLNSGQVKCFTQSNNGTNGSGVYRGYVPFPEKINLGGFAASKVVSKGGQCVLKQNGKVKCLAYGYDSATLGIGYAPNSPPYSLDGDVYGISNAIDLESGARGSVCALLSDRTVKCWGDNFSRQFGATTNSTEYTPVVVNGLSNIKKIAVGWIHLCALTMDGKVKCAGGNYLGQLGNGNTSDSTSMVEIISSDVVDIASGNDFTCVIMTAGNVKCWGTNFKGQLGTGAAGGYSSVPVDVVGITNATSLVTTDYAICALLADKRIKCWGSTMGEGIFGTASFRETATPVFIPNINNAVSISYNDLNGCAILDTGKTKCWGINYTQQLGFGANYVTDYKPAYYFGVDSIVGLATGNSRTQCVIDNIGDVYCTGYSTSNEYIRYESVSGL